MLELLTPKEMGEADRLTVAAGVAGMTLMRAAGRAVADAVEARLTRGASIVVVCGPGNNGGDGFIAAQRLAQRGHRIRVLLLGQRGALRGDAAEAARSWDGPVEAATPAVLGEPATIVDALFGAGLVRPLEGDARALVEAMNASGTRIVAVDLPSGINGATGAIMGAAVTAHETVTFFRRKPGHLLLPARAHCGRVHVVDIGIGDAVLDAVKPAAFANAPGLWGRCFPIPRVDGHKYARGHAVVLSGGIASTGAARLAARGAIRAGAGLVTIASPREALAVNTAASLAVMVRPADGAEELSALLADPRLNAVALGPGGGVGPPMREAVRAACANGRAVVLDADALTSFAGRLPTLRSILANAGALAVLTPHDGEFARLFESLPEIADDKDKLERARATSRHLNAIILLKGADTVVAGPDGRAVITENAPPWLATAGAGDVLAGIIVGLRAQGMPAFEAAAAGAWLHAEAANQFGPGLIAEDLPEELPAVYGRLFARLPSQR